MPFFFNILFISYLLQCYYCHQNTSIEIIANNHNCDELLRSKGQILGPMENITVLSVTASPALYDGQSVIQNTFNGITETTDEKQCYVSSIPNDSRIYYNIPLSYVSKVDIFSVNDTHYSESQLKISVCDGSSCFECGNMPDIPESQWGSVNCPEGARVDTVEILFDDGVDSDLIKFCEIRFHAKRISGLDIQIGELRQLGVLDAKSSPVYAGYIGHSKVQNTYNGIMETDTTGSGDGSGEKTCFVSELLTSSTFESFYIHYNIPMSSVAKVSMFSINRVDIPNYSEANLMISVCKGSLCADCGKMPNIPNASWGSVNCPGAIGDTVKVKWVDWTRPEHVRFCEIRIIGRALYVG